MAHPSAKHLAACRLETDREETTVKIRQRIRFQHSPSFYPRVRFKNGMPIVAISSAEAAIAKKLGISLEDYAMEIMKQEGKS